MNSFLVELTGLASVVTDATERTDWSASKLREHLDEIGRLSGAIRAVAHQANLLAINATIEAARAGVEGRGFEIVAGEMKCLAGQALKNAAGIDACIAAALSVADDNRSAVTDLGAGIRRGLDLIGRMTAAEAAAKPADR